MCRVAAERDGRRDSPALEALDVAARHVVLVRHHVEAEIGDLADLELRVESEASIRVAAAGDVENRFSMPRGVFVTRLIEPPTEPAPV